jgi:hypothetical protein
MSSENRSWALYARFQNQLLHSLSTDDRSCGLEGALNVILEADFSAERTSEDDFRRAAASASRKRRHHLSCFLVPQDGEFDPPDGKDTFAQIVARQALHAIEAGVQRRDDQRLIAAVADGDGYAGIAGELRLPQSSLRSRVLRLRGKFAYLRP